MSDASDGLIYGHLLDGEGGGRRLGWAEVQAWKPEDGVLWLHLDRGHAEAQRWLEEDSGIDAISLEALTADDPRPRSVAAHDRLLVILRGVNTNAGADPEDMVSLRVWNEGRRVVTLRHRRVMAVSELAEALAEGRGPRDVGDLLVELIDGILGRIGELVGELDDVVDALEDEVLEKETYELRPRLSAVRRQAVALRRYLAPQRDTIARLQNEKATWLSDLHRARLREAGDRITRYVEDLDSARDRAAVTQEELVSRLSDQMNRTMYILSIVATIFLPLGLLTGLLGINVGGIPGAEAPWAFWAVTGGLVVIAVALVILFRRGRML